MARIYIGRSTGIGSFERHVVLKLILPERANDKTAIDMFLDEARLAAALNHQNVAQVFEVGEDGGIHYLAMEYVHGQDLRALLAKAGGQGTRVPLELALTVVAGAAAGLNHAHERRGPDGVPLGIVHRDVSPSNIMIGYDGAVKLLDFGIAKATQRSVETQSGIIKGKFAYMAPEQCRGRDVDRRSDVFSLGIILYEISTQHRCFRADSDFDTMHRIVTGDVVRPTRLVPNYPAALEAIVLKALAVDPNQRYQSAGLLLEALESFAVQSRVSLSTMALGRFMREMFGEQQEPWLTSPTGRLATAPIQPRESTISNTNGSDAGDRDRLATTPVPTVQPPVVAAATLPANGPDPWAPSTILDLPRNDQPVDRSATEDPAQAEWNAKSYPTMQPMQPLQPSYANTPPPALVQQGMPPGMIPPPRDSAPHLPPPPPPPQSQSMNPFVPVPPSDRQMIQTGPLPQLPTHQSQPMQMPPPPQQQFMTPGSGTGKSHAGPQYPSANDMSYPRYAAGTSESVDAALALKSNRRPLYIGLGVALFGVIIVLAISFSGDKGPDSKSAAALLDASASTDPVGTDGSDHVGSDPDGSAATILDPKSGSGSAANAKVAIDAVKPDAAVKEPDAPKDAPVKPDAAVAIATTGSGSDTEVGSGSGSAVVIKTPPPPVEEMIMISIATEPEGSDVKLDGTFLGVTPMHVKRKKNNTSGTLVVRHKGFQEQTLKVDMGMDITKSITLKKDEPKKDPPKTGSGTVTPPKKNCQDPRYADPFNDPRPICKT